MPNNILTASRMLSFITCMRQHYWRYEIGLQRTEVSLAFRFGSAFHRGMEARWQGRSYEEASIAAMPDGIELDELSIFTVGALLAGYYDHYGPVESGRMIPEKKFESIICLDFKSMGVIDCLGEIDGRRALIEHKTTSDSVADNSDYWLRLAFNMQILNYVVEARKLGYKVEVIYYDVIRKPCIEPKLIKKVRETPEQFGDRLWQDTRERPEFYFARREVPVIESQIDDFLSQREAIINLILSAREHHAWPKNVSESTCSFCAYKSFCLQGIKIDLDNLPNGFEIKDPSPELKNK